MSLSQMAESRAFVVYLLTSLGTIVDADILNVIRTHIHTDLVLCVQCFNIYPRYIWVFVCMAYSVGPCVLEENGNRKWFSPAQGE